MKFLLRIILAVLFLNASPSFSQQNRFVYLQTENKQPFYVRINDVVYSSSTSGYLIIPKLKDGPYEFVIGFPKNEWPQQKVNYTVDKKDAGFIIKNFGEKGWGLFNLQSLEVLMANSSGVPKQDASQETDDVFAKTLSEVVNSPDLSRKPVEEPKAAEPVVKAVPVVEKNVEVPAATSKVDTPVIVKAEPEPDKEPEIAVSKVERIMSRTTTEGTDLVYIDQVNGVTDTIRIFLPATAVNPVQKEEPPKSEIAKVEPEPTREMKPEKKAEVTKQPVVEKRDKPEFIEMDLPANSGDSIVNQPPAAKSIILPNSDCRSNATEKEFLKLRKKIAGESRTDEMISIARKAFKSDCYTVEQIRNLSVLFFDDAGRYSFFDAAYPFVSDTQNFPSLESAMTDPYYITRFQAMIRR